MFYLMIFSIFVCLYSIYNYFYNTVMLTKKIDFKSNCCFFSGYWYLYPSIPAYLFFNVGDFVEGNWMPLLPKGNITKKCLTKKIKNNEYQDESYFLSEDGYYLKVSQIAYDNIEIKKGEEIKSNWKKI